MLVADRFRPSDSIRKPRPRSSPTRTDSSRVAAAAVAVVDYGDEGDVGAGDGCGRALSMPTTSGPS